MMMTKIEMEEGARWCILRTSPARTLPLARSLSEAGFEVWTPTQVSLQLVRRGREDKREVHAPILPTFVFAGAHQLTDLICASKEEVGPHPQFSIFQWAGRIPLIGASAIAGLREAERASQEVLRAARDHESREEQRRARVAVLKSEQARRKAMRAVHRQFRVGAQVDVANMPAMAGVSVAVVESRGKTALVSFGNHIMEIEAWRVNPVNVEDELRPILA